RIQLSQANRIPSLIPGVEEQIVRGRFSDLVLSREANRREILQSLMAAGEVEHFEMVKPSLHDIFVAIAKPTANEDAIEAE
ncbi:MAG: DUF4162 domain-containing protein, partial [Pirellula staleyi]